MNYFDMYKDVWIFHKKYIDCITYTKVFWDAVIEDINRLGKKYGDCKFIRNLLVNEFAEFERVYNEEKKG